MSTPTTNAYRVRPATEDDLPAVTTLFLASLDTSIPGTTFSDRPEYAYDGLLAHMRKRLLSTDGGAKVTTFVVVGQEGEVAGYANVKEEAEIAPYDPIGEHMPAGVPELDHLFVKVDPAGGGRGLGSALMRKMQEEWREKGLRTQCFEKNERGLKFYRKWGFEEVGRESSPEGDALVLHWKGSQSEKEPNA